jgi:hypothetical protein
MKRVAIIMIAVFFSASIQTNPTFSRNSARLLFKGRIISKSGHAVVGAEVRILDSFGNLLCRVLSDIEGMYETDILRMSIDDARNATLAITHVRFQPIEIADTIAGANIGSPSLTNMTPEKLLPLWALTQTVARNLVLSPPTGIQSYPETGPIDFNRIEYYYRDALLLLDENRRKESIERFKLYAQIGANPIEVKRSLQYFAQLVRQ